MALSGDQLSLLGQELAEQAASDAWKGRWEKAIALLSIRGGEFTTDDVREIAGPPEDHPNAAGALLTRAARAGIIEHVGYRRSDRPVLHRHPLSLWRGVR